MKELESANLTGQKVLVRADLDVYSPDYKIQAYNAPKLGRVMNKSENQKRRGTTLENGKVDDDFRLQAMVSTIKFLVASEAKQIILVGHLDRPSGPDPALSLQPVAEHLSHLLKTPIEFAEHTPDQPQLTSTARLVMLENLKFWAGETKNDPAFARQLAQLGDIYVNESFATSHQSYASIVTLSTLLPAYAGLQLQKEVAVLSTFWDSSPRPIVFLLGGAKTDKIETIKQMIARADLTLVGGVFARDESLAELDHVMVAVDAIGDEEDIGSLSVEMFQEQLKEAQTVLWNGPVGKFEDPRYAAATRQLAQFLGERAQHGELKVVAGGGNTIAALREFGVLDKMTFVSTGGGAMLRLLAEGNLPGIEALS